MPSNLQHRQAAEKLKGESGGDGWSNQARLAVGGVAVVLLGLFALAFPLNPFGRGTRPTVHPARGQVFFEGRPIPGASVVLDPVGLHGPAFPRPQGVVKDDGSCVLGTFEREDGAPTGEYRVLVTWFAKSAPTDADGSPLPKNLLPVRYGKFATSDLTLRIEEGENSLPALKLRR
jgi:hypothetical protein